MTWKELQTWLNEVQHHQQQQQQEANTNDSINSSFDIFKGLPFWIGNVDEHRQINTQTKGRCCFNHVIGLPVKDGRPHKLYDYEMQLTTALHKLWPRHFTIK